MKFGTLALGAVLLTVPLTGQSEGCNGNTPEMVACLRKSLIAVDAELNAEYRKALKVAKDRYKPADVQNLQDAERKWIAYRDAICKAEYGLVGGGTAGPSNQISCLIRVTKQRIADLQAEY
jgi:uncharacterized protein YecT (DUF1311 family)